MQTLRRANGHGGNQGLNSLLAYLMLLVAGMMLLAGHSAAQQDATGVAIQVAPELEGHTLIVKDAGGKELDRIDDLSAGETYEYKLPAGNYDIRLPGITEAFEVGPGQADLFTLGFSSEPVEAGHILSTGAKSLEPGSKELIFSLDPGRRTDDPGPEAPQ